MQLVCHGLGFIRWEGDLWELLGQQRKGGRGWHWCTAWLANNIDRTKKGRKNGTLILKSRSFHTTSKSCWVVGPTSHIPIPFRYSTLQCLDTPYTHEHTHNTCTHSRTETGGGCHYRYSGHANRNTPLCTCHAQPKQAYMPIPPPTLCVIGVLSITDRMLLGKIHATPILGHAYRHCLTTALEPTLLERFTHEPFRS